MKKHDIRKMLLVSVLIAQAMVLSYLETFIPVPFPVPGAKLGLANIITMTAIAVLPVKLSFFTVLMRIVLVAVTFGNPFSMLYSLAGGMLSYALMLVLTKVFSNDVSTVTISIFGAMAHNFGQLCVAVAVLNNVLIFSYLPFLLLISIPTGIFVGMVSKGLIQYLKKNVKN